jgi:hypothetical protein
MHPSQENSNSKCGLCSHPIYEGQKINLHHAPILKSKGGGAVIKVHEACHRNHHSTIGDFKTWGRIGGQISALDKHWAFFLKNVKDDPLYEQARAFYKAHYA